MNLADGLDKVTFEITDSNGAIALVTRMLRRTGWRVLRIWEHELKRTNEARLVRRLFAFIRG